MHPRGRPRCRATVDRRRPHGSHGRGRGQDPGGHPRRFGRDTLKRVSSESRDLGESADAIIDDILGDAGRVSADAQAVEATVNRDQLVAIQTPQCFARDTLVQAYAQESLPQTDDAGILEAQGIEVLVVEGDPSNLKITTREDLVVAEALLKVRKTKPSF